MTISAVVTLYLAHKRALGLRFGAEAAILRAFCRAMDDRPIATVERQNVVVFLNAGGAVTEYWAKKYRVLSGLYRFAMARGLVDRSPLPSVIPKPTGPAFVPYIYSLEELKSLLDAVPAACAGRVPIEPQVFRTLLLVLYGAALRIGEALALRLRDVDLADGCLHIRETKFFKYRLVPLGKDLRGVLTTFVAARTQQLGVAKEVPLFYFRDGAPLSPSAARSAFRRLRTYATVGREGGARRQPRLHDLRHSAAVHRLIAWYRCGADLQDLLPKLATYLGHVDLSATQRYLTLTPELLREASLRFEHYSIGGDHD
jgi:site-specific recombinase XerD